MPLLQSQCGPTLILSTMDQGAKKRLTTRKLPVALQLYEGLSQCLTVSECHSSVAAVTDCSWHCSPYLGSKAGFSASHPITACITCAANHHLEGHESSRNHSVQPCTSLGAAWPSCQVEGGEGSQTFGNSTPRFVQPYQEFGPGAIPPQPTQTLSSICSYRKSTFPVFAGLHLIVDSGVGAVA